MEKINITNNTLSGGIWFGGWLFTIGFLDLPLVEGIFAVVLWPYYLGIFFAPMFGA